MYNLEQESEHDVITVTQICVASGQRCVHSFVHRTVAQTGQRKRDSALHLVKRE